MRPAGVEAFRLLDAGTAERGRRFNVEIPPASPLFAGHFPGHPILPGVVHLVLVERALHDLTDRGSSLSAVRALKLRRPVVPGDALDLLVDFPDGDGWARFELRRGEEGISSGAVQVGRSAEPQRGPGDEALPADENLPAIEALIPHAPPARFIRGVLTASAEEIVCVAEIPLLHPLVEDGRLSSVMGIETGAQAAAVLESLSARKEASGPRIGYLVGVREAHFTASSLNADHPLRVTARLQGGAYPLSIYGIVVESLGCEAVACTISTFIADSQEGGEVSLSTRGG
jgi:predicted hotdog family 3-hydroxylacyl-ACP dehydratase